MGGKGKSQTRSKTGNSFYTWTPGDEIDFVKNLGSGKWSEGSDLRHRQSWWLKQYIQVNQDRTSNKSDRHIIAGIHQARLMLQELGG